MKYFLSLCILAALLLPLGTVTRAEEVKVTVEVADRAKYDELLATKKGKIVLVDFWATWCPPCVKQFSHTVDLSDKYPVDLAVVSVSMDEPEDKEKVLKFLAFKQAQFDNLISSYGVGQEGFEAFQLGDEGVPHYKLYDREGELRHTVTDAKEVDALLETLINEK